MIRLLVATESEIFLLDDATGAIHPTRGLDGHRPTCLTADLRIAWCGTDRGGVFRSDDGGETWRPSGLSDRRVTAVAASPVETDLVWAGTEPSQMLRSRDAGVSWEATRDVVELPSSSEWSFPPKPETHHVRWIACHPQDPGRLWVAIEAGALISTRDGGESWVDRVRGGPWDTHELAVHPEAPETLRISAGDGYFESFDGGATWASPRSGLEVGYLRSVTIDPGRPDAVLVSGATGPRSAYVAGVSDGRIYRREGEGNWQRVTNGWPDPPDTIAPLLATGSRPGEIWAGDERGVHRSIDGGTTWEMTAGFAKTPNHLRGIVLLRGE